MKFRPLRIVLPLLLTALFLFACSPKQPGGFSAVDMTALTLEPDALAEHLLTVLTFDDSLVVIDGEIASRLYNVAGLYEAIAAYGSTGATAEAVLVLRCADAESAAAAAAKIGKYRSEMADVYADYNLPESLKLKEALLSADGRYVVFCVSPDTAAAENAYHAFVVQAAAED